MDSLPPPHGSVTAPTNATILHDALHASKADVWGLKPIVFGTRRVKIITQNFNGPCSFIAICNILILRGDIILPPSRETVSYEFLSHLLAEHILTSVPDVDVSSALSAMPLTQSGMHLNPRFTSPNAFHPPSISPSTVENATAPPDPLALLAHAQIPIVHGWLPSPDTPAGRVLVTNVKYKIRDEGKGHNSSPQNEPSPDSEHGGIAESDETSHEQNGYDYDAAVALVAEADHVAGGRVLWDGEGDHQPPEGQDWTPEERAKIDDALTIRAFLSRTSSQLTEHGLSELSNQLEPGALVALFRASHVAVLHKPCLPPDEPTNLFADPDATGKKGTLYTLATDAAFLHEPAVVWERLDGVAHSAFVSADFVEVGKRAGYTPPVEGDGTTGPGEDWQTSGEGEMTDHVLAEHLQAEENQRAAEAYAASAERARIREERVREEETLGLRDAARREEARGGRLEKKRSCIVM